MSVYLKGDAVVISDGLVAVDEECCCNNGACCVDTTCSVTTETHCDELGGVYQGDNTDCDPNPCDAMCNCTSLLPPFFNSDDGLYYKTRIDDCCALSTTYSTPCSPTLRFATLTATNEACNPGYTGSCTNVNHFYLIDETCDLVRILCEGDITTDPGGHCIEGCSEGCDVDCNFGGCQPNTKNTQTLSDEQECYGACCDCFGCAYPRTQEQCAEAGGTWYPGEVCEDACPTGACCDYVGGVLNSCGITTESQCQESCCDPPCPTHTLVWHPELSTCDDCPPTP